MSQYLLLGVSFVLGFLASVLANVINPRIINFMDARKLLRQSKRYETAAAFHKMITELHSGKRDKYLYLARMRVSVTVGATVAFVCMVGGFVIGYIHSSFFSDQTDAVGAAYILPLFFLSMFMFGTYMVATVRYKRISDALDNFDEFDAEFKQNWPERIEQRQTS